MSMDTYKADLIKLAMELVAQGKSSPSTCLVDAAELLKKGQK